MSDSTRHLNVKTNGEIIEVWYGNKKRETTITLCVARTGESNTLYEVTTFILCWMAKIVAADAPFNIEWFMNGLPAEVIRWAWYRETSRASEVVTAPWEMPVPLLIQHPIKESPESRVGRPYKTRDNVLAGAL